VKRCFERPWIPAIEPVHLRLPMRLPPPEARTATMPEAVAPPTPHGDCIVFVDESGDLRACD
jgi:hypothetical protein